MTPLPPIINDQQKKDSEHVKLLSIFHFIFAGLALVGIAFLFLHYFAMNAVFSNPALWKSQPGAGPPPQEFFAIFRWFYVVFGILLVVGGLANVLSGLFLRQRKHRIFSLIVGGLNCLQVPFGTALGVFTIIVLLRDSIRESYETRRAFS